MTIPFIEATDSRLSHGRWLRIPGPTVVHPRVVEAQTADMIPHRAPEMYGFMDGLRAKLAALHKTQQQVLIWSGSGSAGFETGILNLLSPGDTVVATVGGAFGQRFADVGEMYGLDVRRLDVAWGESVSPDAFGEALDQAGSVKAVFVTHNETSTGVTNPLRELAALANAKGAMVLVDAVSSAAAMELRMDDWGLDFVFSGVQKAWMCPPGLMVAGVSERARHAAKSTTFPRFYFNLETMAKAAEEGSTATTPAMSLLYGLDAATDVMMEEGVENVWARHERLGKAFRASLSDLGLRVLPVEACASNSVTAFHTPEGYTAPEFQKALKSATQIIMTTGIGQQADTINRVGHMGWAEQPELDATIEGIAKVLAAGPGQ